MPPRYLIMCLFRPDRVVVDSVIHLLKEFVAIVFGLVTHNVHVVLHVQAAGAVSDKSTLANKVLLNGPLVLVGHLLVKVNTGVAGKINILDVHGGALVGENIHNWLQHVHQAVVGDIDPGAVVGGSVQLAVQLTVAVSEVVGDVIETVHLLHVQFQVVLVGHRGDSAVNHLSQVKHLVSGGIGKDLLGGAIELQVDQEHRHQFWHLGRVGQDRGIHGENWVVIGGGAITHA